MKGTLAQLILLRQVMEACQETLYLKAFAKNGSAGSILGHIVSQLSRAILIKALFRDPAGVIAHARSLINRSSC